MISLYPVNEFKLPITAECMTPDVLLGKTREEIETLKVWVGNKQKLVGELFKVEESKTDDMVLAFCGDVSKVHRIGACMKKGEVRINGNVGMHLGEEMKGGRIIVHGNAGAWAGSMMKGGEIEIHGDAGDYLGAPYRGSREGMNGGKITAYGNVGSEAGAHMRNGLIKVYGNAGQFVGFRMRDGIIYVEKAAETRSGACMTGGKIVVGGFFPSVLPTFTVDSIKAKVKIEEQETVNGPFYVFLGDLTENGDGKLYIHKERNPQLSHYERLL
jgi:formylmethanofuran dehydrogenase subunit C